MPYSVTFLRRNPLKWNMGKKSVEDIKYEVLELLKKGKLHDAHSKAIDEAGLYFKDIKGAELHVRNILLKAIFDGANFGTGEIVSIAKEHGIEFTQSQLARFVHDGILNAIRKPEPDVNSAKNIAEFAALQKVPLRIEELRRAFEARKRTVANEGLKQSMDHVLSKYIEPFGAKKPREMGPRK
jgi:hypothetical protein